jgi:hypothetical protein
MVITARVQRHEFEVDPFVWKYRDLEIAFVGFRHHGSEFLLRMRL